MTLISAAIRDGDTLHIYADFKVLRKAMTDPRMSLWSQRFQARRLGRKIFDVDAQVCCNYIEEASRWSIVAKHQRNSARFLEFPSLNFFWAVLQVHHVVGYLSGPWRVLFPSSTHIVCVFLWAGPAYGSFGLTQLVGFSFFVSGLLWVSLSGPASERDSPHSFVHPYSSFGIYTVTFLSPQIIIIIVALLQ